MKKRALTTAACGFAVLSLSMSGCGASFEGSGSKDAASAEQLALRTDDPWAIEIEAQPTAKAETPLHDGVYVGEGKGMEGPITVTLLVDDNHISCLEMTQEGESQSRGGYEAIRDGKYAQMIEAAQGADIDTISGATITTAGVKQAVEDALAKAEQGVEDQSAMQGGEQ
ncbi:FMN-binding protein [Eggerthellaceae bacterium 3-80]|nr:FMN-binding protein [bacterium D16-34]